MHEAHTDSMGTRTAQLIAFVITMVYGLSFALLDDPPRAWVVLGGVAVAAGWVCAGMVHNRERT